VYISALSLQEGTPHAKQITFDVQTEQFVEQVLEQERSHAVEQAFDLWQLSLA